MKSGNLNFPEPSGPLQACNGTALPFTNLTLLYQVQMVVQKFFQPVFITAVHNARHYCPNMTHKMRNNIFSTCIILKHTVLCGVQHKIPNLLDYNVMRNRKQHGTC